MFVDLWWIRLNPGAGDSADGVGDADLLSKSAVFPTPLPLFRETFASLHMLLSLLLRFE